MKLSPVKIRRLNTGVPGLDDVLGGGVPELSFNLIVGPPGSGKTTLAHQMMFALATPERPALYFTALGELPVKILRYQQQFSYFDLDRLNHAIRFNNLADDVACGKLAQVLERIAAEVAAHEPGFVFLDSFRSVVLIGQRSEDAFMALQQFIHSLSLLMTSWQATTFLISECFSETDLHPLFKVADGVLSLRQSTQGNSVVRKLDVTKMRGQATLPGLHTFRINEQGIRVFAPPPRYAPAATTQVPRVDHRMSVGVAALDDMLGGGVPCGYSLLVAGPSGSGKSILAAAFLAEGARVGETGVIAAFEQRPSRSRGEVMAQLIASDRIGVVDTLATNLSVDEIAMLLIAEVHRLKASRVVIDSLSGFELALAPTFRADYREALSRLVSALASTGVTVLMTSELEDRYDDLRFSPYGTAFLTDAIIVQRYVEVDGRLLRVMSVVKVRGSPHDNALRQFHIDDQGIQVGAVLSGLEGLLTGRPAWRASPSPQSSRP